MKESTADRGYVKNQKMPPACPVEHHFGSYEKAALVFQDAATLCGGDSRLVLFAQRVSRSPSIARMSLPGKPVAVRRFVSFPWSCDRQSPLGQPGPSFEFSQVSTTN